MAIRSDSGFTLVEAIVGVAVTTLIGLVVMSMILVATKTQQTILRQTDDVDSLRVAALMIQEDARLSRECEDLETNKSIRLIRTFQDPDATIPDVYTEYVFKVYRANGLHQNDPSNLHRWEFRGGVFHGDTVVGWGLKPPASNSTQLKCISTGDSNTRGASARLVKAVQGSQSRNLELQVIAFTRQYSPR